MVMVVNMFTLYSVSHSVQRQFYVSSFKKRMKAVRDLAHVETDEKYA